MYIDHDREHDSQGAPTHSPTPELAQIMEVSLQRLERGDKTETSKLLTACREDGVFYLNLQTHENHDGPLLSLSTEIFDLSKKLFELPLDEKMNYDIDTFGTMKVNGYKPVGRNKGGLAGGKDGFESYAIAKAFIDSPNTYTTAEHSNNNHNTHHPVPIVTHLPLLQDFATKVTSTAATLLRSLSTTLDLAPGHGLEAHHRPEAPSPSMLRLLKYAAQSPSERGAPQTPHTDLGSLTLLFTRAPGLQRWNPCLRRCRRRHQKHRCSDDNDNDDDDDLKSVLESESESEAGWEFIAPRPHCAIVNVGDVLVALSGGLLHSCLHRVVPLPGQRMEERFSFAWMVRPEPATLMTALKGGAVPPGVVGNGGHTGGGGGEEEVLTSGEWLERKFTVLRK